jgi:hypothetical protein
MTVSDQPPAKSPVAFQIGASRWPLTSKAPSQCRAQLFADDCRQAREHSFHRFDVVIAWHAECDRLLRQDCPPRHGASWLPNLAATASASTPSLPDGSNPLCCARRSMVILPARLRSLRARHKVDSEIPKTLVGPQFIFARRQQVLLMALSCQPMVAQASESELSPTANRILEFLLPKLTRAT